MFQVSKHPSASTHDVTCGMVVCCGDGVAACMYIYIWDSVVVEVGGGGVVHVMWRFGGCAPLECWGVSTVVVVMAVKHLHSGFRLIT